MSGFGGIVYTKFAKGVYYPVLDRLKRTNFVGAFEEAMRNERLGPEELRKVQLLKLDGILRHAYLRSPAYRKLWGARRLEAGAGALGECLFELPLLTKSFVYENWSEMLTRPASQLIKGTTSGSTGASMTFYMSPSHVSWVLASQWRGRGWWGVERGDREFILWGRPYEGTMFSELSAWMKYRLRNSLQFSSFEESDGGEVANWVSALRRFEPRIIYGYGSSLARLGEGMLTAGGAATLRRSPVFIEYTADHMSESERERTSRAFAAPVLSAYGASECGGIAQECREGRLHVSIDHVLLEVLDKNGDPVPENEIGELVVTTLNNTGMPLVRYRIGDLGALESAACRCGSPLPVMRLQAGKAVDLVSTTEKEGVSAHVLDYINMSLMRHGVRGIRQFYVEQEAPDDFVLQVVKEEPFDPLSVEVFVSKMRVAFGQSVRVEVVFVESIGLQDTGKRRYFKKTFV